MSLDRDRLVAIAEKLDIEIRFDRESGIYDENGERFDFEDIMGDFINHENKINKGDE